VGRTIVLGVQENVARTVTVVLIEKGPGSCTIENNMKNCWADAGGGVWRRIEAQTANTGGMVKKQGVVNN
jgi:hypothetical protein